MPLIPYGFASIQVRRLDLLPLKHIRSQTARSFVPEEYVLLNGNPARPTYWINMDSSITSDGTYYKERPSILDINSDAFVRFVPTTDTWDPIANVWSPLFSQAAVRYELDGAIPTVPALSETDYQIGRELFSPAVLDFDETTQLVSNFDSGADDAFAFTIAMAVNLQESGYNLLTFDDGTYIKVIKSGFEAKVDGHKFTVSIPRGPTAYTPIYLVLEIAPPKATLVVATGPTKIFQGTSSVSARTTSFIFTLSGVMELMSLDIWGDDRPTTTEIVAHYASVLGAN